MHRLLLLIKRAWHKVFLFVCFLILYHIIVFIWGKWALIKKNVYYFCAVVSSRAAEGSYSGDDIYGKL